MPDWDTYKSEARARGSLAFELFVVHSTPALSPEEVKAQLPAHLAYQATLEDEGALVFAGPLSDESGTQMQGMGMIIYRAPSFEQARALADADPMHASGARSYVLRKWMINEGSLTMTVSLSRQSVALG
ncbi:MAG: YciI family protein [Pseudomonadota bacterium]